MRDLSGDIELAIKDSITGMSKILDIDKVDDDKLARLVASRTESFSSIKEMIMLWQNSPNAPSYKKLREYTQNLIDAGDNSILTLRQALRKEIDFEELEAEKFGTAIKSKPIIYRAINEIDSGLHLLRLQMESDSLDFKEREFRPGFPERYANQEFFPEKDYYKEWYDEENDAIILDPKGTKGKLIVLDNLPMFLPAEPEDKTTILFHDLPKEEQYWRRPEQPPGLTPDTEDMYHEHILEEFRRRREGLFFYNNGEVVWLCPAHYIGLVHNKMLDSGGYKEFRMAQAMMYYFTLAVNIDIRCCGELFTKGRRTGFTEEIIDYFVNDSTSMKNALMGITSKTGDDAQEAYLKYQYGIQNLPFYFIPVVKGKIDDRNKMEFGKVSDSSKAAKKKKDTNTDDYLNTKVDWMNATTLAYDSKKLKRYLCDESGKREKPQNIIDHYSNVKPTLITGGRVVGKAYLGSTLNPLDKGGREFQILHYGSDVTKRNANGRTSTGLYSFFLPAHKNMEDYTDKYGICHETVKPGEFFYNAQGEKKTIGSLQFLENEFKSAKAMGSKTYNNARRLDPITIEDAFRDEVQSQLFDIEKINGQMAFNRRMEVEKGLVRGNFKPSNPMDIDSDIIWEPKTDGRFLVSWLPPKEMRNQFVYKNVFGIHCKAPVHDYGAFGVDSYDQTAVIDAKLIGTENGTEWSLGSKGSMHGVTEMNMEAGIPSNEFFLEYIARPKSADMFFEDCLMACRFYSLPILAENNKKMLLKHFKTRGYRGYSITRFDKDVTRLSPDEKELGGAPSSGEDMKVRHWSSIESYIDNYVGEYSVEEGETPIREIGAMGRMPFNRTLSDWLQFDPDKRTKFDASMSSGLALMAIRRSMYKVNTAKKGIAFTIRR